jgi:N-ethylmaleimide reductase
MEPSPGDLELGVPIKNVTAAFGSTSKHCVITNGGYDLPRAQQVIREGTSDMVSFGRPFIANPDLVFRFQNGVGLNEASPQTFYGQGPESTVGYTDYKFATTPN